MKWFNPVYSIILFSCSGGVNEAEKSEVVNRLDTAEMIRGFIYGLWSMDSGNTLYNEGFFFKPDGTVDFVAGEASGTWMLNSNDSLKIVYSSYNEEFKTLFRIDSITGERMILSSGEGRHLFRKVPFGMNAEGSVLRGFMGSLGPGEEKFYSFDIPAAKKISLKLQSDDPSIFFMVYDGNNEITSAPLRDWTAIMIRSGQYRVVVYKPKDDKKEKSDFDLKVMGY